MIWQDAVITIASIVFSISLLPQVDHGFRHKIITIKVATSLPTFLGLYAITFAYVTLALYFSAATAFITGTLWLVLFLQHFLYGKKETVD
jgi:hypothetical protein